jgi:hypothetical protein
VDRPSSAPEQEPIPWLPLDGAHLSAIDGSGAQVLLLVRRWELGTRLLANVVTGTWGIKDGFGHYRSPAGEGRCRSCCSHWVQLTLDMHRSTRLRIQHFLEHRAEPFFT